MSCQKENVLTQLMVATQLPSWSQQVWNLLTGIPMTLTVAAVTLAIALLPGSMDGLQFDIQAGQWWTLLTSHLVHYNGEHLFWDLVVFIGVGAALERKRTRLFVATLLLTALAIPPLAVLWQSSVMTYRGLSGVDTALFAAFAMHELIGCFRKQKHTEALLYGGLLVAMIGKSLFELVTGATMFVSSDEFVALPAAHLVGAGIGLMLATAAHGRFYRARTFNETP